MEDFGLVSIVMPSYNSEKYIKASVESVIAQSYKNWELLIVDDCSTDETVKIIKSFKDKRIILFQNEKNSGAALSRNWALREAKGKWIAFLDSDDLWLPTKLEEQLCFMAKNDYGFSYTDYRICNDGVLTNKVITAPKKMTFRKIKRYCYVATLTIMFDFEKVGLIQISDIKKNNDYAMWLKAFKKTDGYRLPICLAVYNKHTGSISSEKKTKLIKWHYILFRQEMKYNSFRSFLMVVLNLWFGFWKKRIYRRKIKSDENEYLMRLREL